VEQEAYHPLPFNAEFKNDWIYRTRSVHGEEGRCFICIKKKFVLSAIFWTLTSFIHVHFDGTYCHIDDK